MLLAIIFAEAVMYADAETKQNFLMANNTDCSKKYSSAEAFIRDEQGAFCDGRRCTCGQDVTAQECTDPAKPYCGLFRLTVEDEMKYGGTMGSDVAEQRVKGTNILLASDTKEPELKTFFSTGGSAMLCYGKELDYKWGLGSFLSASYGNACKEETGVDTPPE